MQSIFSILSTACESGMASYRHQYVINIKDCLNLANDAKLLRAHIKSKDIATAESLLKFSLVFNDLSLLTLTSGNQLAVLWFEPEWFEQYLESPNLTIIVTSDKLKQLGLQPDLGPFTPGLVFPDGDQANTLLARLQPFIDTGKLLLQPHRLLFFDEDKGGEEKSPGWGSIEVDQFSPVQHWELIDEGIAPPVPLTYQVNDHLDQRVMFEITIPYIDGVDFKNLAKVLEDEGDLVSGLRLSIKNALQACGSGANPIEIARDIIDPSIDALTRKFKSTVNTHAFRVAGAALGTVVLAYTAVATSGTASVIATVCGSGGLGLLGKEYSAYRERLNSLKDDPYYFLWRCKSIIKK